MATSPLTMATTCRDNALFALAEDLLSPQPTYSLDGESVSREAWRDGMQRTVEWANKMIQIYGPFEIRSQVL